MQCNARLKATVSGLMEKAAIRRGSSLKHLAFIFCICLWQFHHAGKITQVGKYHAVVFCQFAHGIRQRAR